MTVTKQRFLDVQQAAERLNKTERFVRRLIEERRIAYFKFGRAVRIGEDDLEQFIAAGRVEPVGRGLRRVV
ncbi:helix-turn-helix domain-containing protein [Actinocatenispora comari]|jgi:excisionase family DNA binding protein|uniref:DNA-binding protein n=1 Tax=Actinocatenispora comari TaxID=2807577 RepID=A0A8J4AJ29_9ACTN|nr:helix-turn-helix domain-containing protein [Actinocatenispora comari]GIL30440.1 DNA-binding protein [Actinocatenispora comari]